MAEFPALYITATLSTLLVLWAFTLLALLVQLFPGNALTCSDIPYIIQSPSISVFWEFVSVSSECHLVLNYTPMNV